MLRQYKLRNYNFRLVIYVLALSIIGYLAIGSARISLQSKHLNGIFMGLGFMIFASLLDYSLYSKVRWGIYIFNLILLILVLTPLGVAVNGARRWLSLGIQFQPSEMSKILLILFFSAFIMKYKERFNTFRNIIFMIILLIVPLFLIYKEPDLSTSIMLIVTFCIMLLIGGLEYRVILSAIAVVIPLGVIFFSIILQEGQTILKGYQITRILAWLDPEKYADSAAYQQTNSITAIGSGMLLGKGLNNNVIASVKNGNFISEPQTDFIYAVIGEEMGFIGAASVIVLLLLIAFECALIAKRSKDLCGAIIADAMAGLVCIQGLMNIAVATGFLPNTGIPLPFVSYGLTSLVSLYFGIGIVLNVGLQGSKRKTSTYES
jgi:rod shape determining protein RodA